MAEKPEKLFREREYNPPEDERADWRRLVRKYAGRITGAVTLHVNEGEPLKVHTRREDKQS